jgi:hypothetical protein
VSDCTVSGNTAIGGGGGITNALRGQMTITNSTVSENTAYRGGGIENWGIMTARSCTFSENTGGIWNRGTVTMTNSAVSENGARGIVNTGALTLTNSTLSHQDSSQVALFNSLMVGGPLFGCLPGSATFSSVTVVGRISNFCGGEAVLARTLVDGDCAGSITSNGFNIESPGDTCSFDQSSDRVGVSANDLMLGELADNGGPTLTHALELSSVAIDRIPEAMCEVDEDQRGEPRPAGPEPKRCDVGSFEVQP